MKFTYCETMSALGHWHIRTLDERGKMLSGIWPRNVKTLCGLEAAWDIYADITPDRRASSLTTCRRCADKYDIVGAL